MRPSVWTTTGDKAKVASIETLPELLDFGVFDEDDFTELLLDFAELLLDFEVFEDEDFTKELLDFGILEEDWTELLLDFGAPEELEDLTDELLDCGALDEEDFTTLLLDCATLDEEDFGALEELETFEELELLEALIAANTLSINSSETVLFNTGYLSASDCVQAEPSKP
jgi:hypothetical protein